MKVQWTMRGETDIAVDQYSTEKPEDAYEDALKELTPRDYAKDAKYLDIQIPDIGVVAIVLKEIKWNKEG